MEEKKDCDLGDVMIEGGNFFHTAKSWWKARGMVTKAFFAFFLPSIVTIVIGYKPVIDHSAKVFSDRRHFKDSVQIAKTDTLINRVDRIDRKLDRVVDADRVGR